MQFDPMTGEPIEEQQNEENMQFDPMTGEPIGQAAKEEQPAGCLLYTSPSPRDTR